MNWGEIATAPCPYCGMITAHTVLGCPNVAEIEYYENGTIKRVVKRGPLYYWRLGPQAPREEAK